MANAVSPTEVQSFRHAADQGDAAAQSRLGSLYETGQGVRQDYDEAVKWYRLAADKGNISAIYNLGMFHAYGKGVRQDYVEAARLFRLCRNLSHCLQGTELKRNGM